ncbi:hypothetical protein BT63DRAFT_419505 [Microthyrium microscopicum]|uniref:Saccharopine dehydrogenase NADP binding domain-containing protein n=1 Tax=Microthyrium microscopicum TaxID=703497 RepID=A0A6A6UPJ4_9PEZI|nr:hypothetical protein BT63DRAFT_419505 [Microthyrium microscopicum]
MASRQYDLIVYGATGHTGKYTVDYLQENAPTDLKWAIAGRNASKLSTIASDLKTLNSDRVQPGVEAINHDPTDLATLAAKTKVLISCVGPFWKYGTPVIEACVNAGTHYIDITGEIPWVYDMINRFHERAVASKTVLIPQCGIDSAPSDLIAHLLVRYIRSHYNEGTLEVVNCIHAINNTVSGGTAATALSIADAYSPTYLLKSMAPFALSPVRPIAAQKQLPANRGSILNRLKGYVKVPELGLLTDWLGNGIDSPIVQRSWGLFDGGALYGRNFKFVVWLRAPSPIRAILQAWFMAIAGLFVILPPTRWLLKKFAPQPGEGARGDKAKDYFVRYKALATSDSGKRVVASLDMPADLYYWTGVLVAQAALELLRGGESKAKNDGGILTPSTLGEGYVDRLASAGLHFKLQSVAS